MRPSWCGKMAPNLVLGGVSVTQRQVEVLQKMLAGWKLWMDCAAPHARPCLVYRYPGGPIQQVHSMTVASMQQKGLIERSLRVRANTWLWQLTDKGQEIANAISL